MSAARTKPVIAIVGSIGAGKSTAAKILAECGGAWIVADALGHEALEQPDIVHRVVAKWGPSVLMNDGTVDRRALAKIVFHDTNERKSLENMVYPYIGQRVREELAKVENDPKFRFAVLDAAVLLEAGWTEIYDRLLFVDAPRTLRYERLTIRSRWSDSELTAREAAQMPLDEKRRRADAIVVNDSTPSALRKQLVECLERWNIRCETPISI